MSKKGKREAPRKSMKGWVKALLIVLAVLLVLGGTGYGVFRHYYSKLSKEPELTQQEIDAAVEQWRAAEPDPAEELQEGEEPIPVATAEEVDLIQQEIMDLINAEDEKLSDKNVWNILLIGSDARDRTRYSRSDAMILISINKETKQIVLTSFMRDIYTYIPKAGFSNRLNVPYAIGGAPFLMDTIEQVFGIHIDNYISVNFYSFVEVVDALGGVDIEVTESEINEMNKNLDGQNELLENPRGTDRLKASQAGLLHLDGNQALAYSRIRHIDGDGMRTQRQRTVITALIQKARSASMADLKKIVELLLPMVSTDLSESKCLTLVLNAAEYKDYEIKQIRIPSTGEYFHTMIDGMSVLKVDFKACRKQLQEEIYGITE